jgi:ferrous iron transport protein B
VEKKAKRKKVVLLGLPNTGKTSLFNSLTQQYGVVANYPHTTIEIQRGETSIQGEPWEVIDTPGLHSLYIHSEEELLLRKVILEERPDMIIQCVDLDRIKQSLFLTADLAELHVPLVLALNDISETVRSGKQILYWKLEEMTGLPVVETKQQGRKDASAIKKALVRAGVPETGTEYPNSFEEVLKDLEKEISRTEEEVPYTRKLALLMLQKDPYIFTDTKWLPSREVLKRCEAGVDEFLRDFGGSVHRGRRIAESLAAMSRHPIYGIPLLIGFLAGSFFLVVEVAGFLEGLLSGYLFDPITQWLQGVLPPGSVQGFFIGEYGILTLGVFSALGTVLPILSVFFLLFGFLEDVGYLPNLGILIRRGLKGLGLTGKSIMPLVLGFGCKTMATLTARSIPSKKEKFIAIFLIAFAVPCSAQLGLNMAILGKAGIGAFFIAIAFLLLVEIGAGSILNRVIHEDQKTNFLQELPRFKMPNLQFLLKKTGYRMLWFLKESLLIFVIAAAVLFFLDLLHVLLWVQNDLSTMS